MQHINLKKLQSFTSLTKPTKWSLHCFIKIITIIAPGFLIDSFRKDRARRFWETSTMVVLPTNRVSMSSAIQYYWSLLFEIRILTIKSKFALKRIYFFAMFCFKIKYIFMFWKYSFDIVSHHKWRIDACDWLFSKTKYSKHDRLTEFQLPKTVFIF